MSVSNGQLANATTFNNAFVSKSSDSTVTGTITQENASVLKEISTPATPVSGYGKIYFKADGKLYQMNDAGVESEVGSGAGGGGGWTSDSSLSLADGDQIATSSTIQLQKWRVRAATSAGAVLSVVPFATTPTQDGTTIRLVRDSDENFVSIENYDASGGCILNGSPAQLFKYHLIDLMWDATMQRWIEISRNF